MKKILFILISLIAFSGVTIAQQTRYTNHYIARTGLDQQMPFYSYVTYDDQYLEYSDAIEIGAFINGECRMSTFLVDPTIYGDPHPSVEHAIAYSYRDFDETGAQILFKMYNHETGIEYDYCANDYVVRSNGYVDWGDPDVLRFYTTTNLVINQYTTNGGWYLIASPLAATVSPTVVENMISSTEANYDLYFFDQAGTGNGKEWKNWKEDPNPNGSTNYGFNLVPGKGYLYANNEDVTLTFIGAPYNGTNVVELSRAATVANEKLRGWNLIGNSFTTAKTIGGRGYYRMNPVGRSELIAGTGNIDAMEGIFVYYDPEDADAANREETVTFTNPSLKRAEGDDMVLLTLNRNNGGAIDRVIVRFDEGGTLPKYTLRDNSTIIYIPQADRDYAVVKGSATNVFPVNFKTEDFGTYTLSADIAGANVDYMHLIDKITGEDVDMLLESEYSFVAAPVDREDRFILRLTYSGYFDNESDIFAYQNGSDIVVCGEGTLQVFDVMGRFVTSYEVNGVQSIQAMPMGVYIFRMLGDDVKTQKIYVR